MLLVRRSDPPDKDPHMLRVARKLIGKRATER
jgi:hypothetical protein